MSGAMDPTDNSHDNIGNYVQSAVDSVDPWPMPEYESRGGIDVRSAYYDKARDVANHQALANYEPIIEDWWPKHSQAIKGAMQEQLKSIKDPGVRAHIWRNFQARAKSLDEMAQFGLGNYGLSDWRQYPVPIYKPNEMTDEEAEEEQDRRRRQQQGQ
jgi:hypothetical protein